jgi:uncharacterized protein (TIGR03086 family)
MRDALGVDPFTTLLEHDRQAVLLTVELAEQAGPADANRPTPCAGWHLTKLMTHLASQQVGFAAAARGAGADLRVWGPTDLGYRQAAADALAAFAEPGLAERRFDLPEIRSGGGFPAPMAVSFHFLDNVVHAWDLAVTLGRPVPVPDELARAALPIARAVPTGASRNQPGAAFGPDLPVPDGASAMEEILLLLGRDPAWRPAAA